MKPSLDVPCSEADDIRGPYQALMGEESTGSHAQHRNHTGQPQLGNPFARPALQQQQQQDMEESLSAAHGRGTFAAPAQQQPWQRTASQNGARPALKEVLLPTARAESGLSAISLSEARRTPSAEMTRQTSLLQTLGTQVSDEVALRVLAVRTDAVTGLPLDVYQEPPTARFRPPGEMLHIPDIEDAETKWMDQQPLMAAWMAASVVTLLSSLFWLPLGFIGGLLGITGASLMVCRCHHCISFALAVKGMQVLASICLVLSASLAAVLLYVVLAIRCNPQAHSANYCHLLTSTLCILILWHCTHAVLSAAVSIHSSNVKRLIDPVKSGVILLRRPRTERSGGSQGQSQAGPEGAYAERQV